MSFFSADGEVITPAPVAHSCGLMMAIDANNTLNFSVAIG